MGDIVVQRVATPPTLQASVNNIPAMLSASRFGATLLQSVNNIDARVEQVEASNEIDELEGEYPGLIAALSGKSTEEDQVKWAVALRARIREDIYKPCITNSMTGLGTLTEAMDELLNQPRTRNPLKASLIMDPIDYRPPYKPVWKMLLKQGPTKDWQALMSGQDSIEWENPIPVGVAYAWNPAASPDKSNMVDITGGKTTVYPYFIKTQAYRLNVFEWAKRLIKPIAIKKIQLQMELDKMVDSDVIAAIDAATPDGSLYSSHPTHIKADAGGAVTLANFKIAGRKFVHTDATGTPHVGNKSVALCDTKAIWDIEDWGNDEWSEQTVQEFNSQGFPITYDSGQVAGIKVNGWSIAQNPLATSTFKIRFVGEPGSVGLMVPVSFQGKAVYTTTIPMMGKDPDYNQIRNMSTPPSFDFWIDAYMGMAIVIPGWYNLAQLNQT